VFDIDGNVSMEIKIIEKIIKKRINPSNNLPVFLFGSKIFKNVIAKIDSRYSVLRRGILTGKERNQK
ncbi:hypothetical protein OAV24_04100, partial [Gammaproteobacteria bacterium]|nr:hypothetical protein [Gammaproteobacteria bacterium]